MSYKQVNDEEASIKSMSHGTPPSVLQPFPTSPRSAGGGVVATVVYAWGHPGLSPPSVLCLKLFTALSLTWTMVSSLEVQDLGSSRSCPGSEQRFKRRSPGVKVGGEVICSLCGATATSSSFKDQAPPETLIQDSCFPCCPERKDRAKWWLVPELVLSFADPLWASLVAQRW